MTQDQGSQGIEDSSSRSISNIESLLPTLTAATKKMLDKNKTMLHDSEVRLGNYRRIETIQHLDHHSNVVDNGLRMLEQVGTHKPSQMTPTWGVTLHGVHERFNDNIDEYYEKLAATPRVTVDDKPRYHARINEGILED